MVNVNTVYTTVLYLLNKEQRGYLTPAEFNSIGAQVQEEIFNSYFPDGNQTNRQNQNNTQNDTEFFDVFNNISYKLYPFQQEILFVNPIGSTGFVGPNDIYLIGEIISKYSGQPTYESITEIVSKRDYNKITRSKLTAPSKNYPLGYIENNTVTVGDSPIIFIAPTPNEVKVNVLKKPTPPDWKFFIGGAGQYVYDNVLSVNFELDTSEQTNIIIGILKYAGLIINDPTIIQTAAQEAMQVEQNEKA
tara:strand:+ start:678 stop:1418 length:741 start_codon:yes stop_codon:yes gene_type:complete